jgi:hypothetical protein
MKLRMYQIDIEVNEDDEIVISQERREGGPASGVVISLDQVEFLNSLLQKAKEEIESRREAGDEEEESEEIDHRSGYQRRK